MASAASVNVYPDGPAAAGAAAQAIAVALADAQAERGLASVALSGGSTPAPMFAALAKLDVDWANVHLYQVDERVVDDRHLDRNATALEDDLLCHIAIPRDHVHLMPVLEDDLAAAAQRYGSAVSRLDVVHLGLGADGHTASWPPGDAVVNSPNTVDLTDIFDRYRRMTLTPRAIDRARLVIWLITGAQKHAALVGLSNGDRSMPASRAFDERSVLFVDTAAETGAAH